MEEAYNFNAREEYDYRHSFEYLGGMLGQQVIDEANEKKSKEGKVDYKLFVRPPMDPEFVKVIVKTAETVVRSDKGEKLENHIRLRNKDQLMFRFLDNTIKDRETSGAAFYAWVKHCVERKVNWEQADPTRRGAKGDDGPVVDADDSMPVDFKAGAIVEILGLKARPELNGKHATVIRKHEDTGRYEVRVDALTILKVKPDNLMFAPMEEQPDDDEDVRTDLAPGTKVELHSLQGARHLNGQRGEITFYDKDAGRYEVRMKNGDIKRLKPENVKVTLPEGWSEHFDEHSQRFYYVNTETKKRQWKHPVAMNKRAKMGKVAEEGQKNEDREGYKDPEEEEEKEKTAESEQRKKKKGALTAASLLEDLLEIKEQTMEERVTPENLADFGPANIGKEMDSYMALLKESGDDVHPHLLKTCIEFCITAIEVQLKAALHMQKNKFLLQEINKYIKQLQTMESTDTLIEQMEWSSSLLKTM